MNFLKTNFNGNDRNGDGHILHEDDPANFNRSWLAWVNTLFKK